MNFQVPCCQRKTKRTKRMLEKEDLDRIASMARLRLTEEEEQHLLKELGAILALIEEMRAIDVSSAPSMTHIFSHQQRLRKDKAVSEINRDKFLENAPDKSDHMYRVPKVLD